MKRGEIYWIEIQSNVEHLNNGFRPVLIVSNNKCNEFSSCISVVPLTTAMKKPIPTHVNFLLNRRWNTTLCEQVFIANKCDILENNFICEVSNKIMDKVSIALMKQFGIMEV